MEEKNPHPNDSVKSARLRHILKMYVESEGRPPAKSIRAHHILSMYVMYLESGSLDREIMAFPIDYPVLIVDTIGQECRECPGYKEGCGDKMIEYDTLSAKMLGLEINELYSYEQLLTIFEDKKKEGLILTFDDLKAIYEPILYGRRL